MARRSSRREIFAPTVVLGAVAGAIFQDIRGFFAKPPGAAKKEAAEKATAEPIDLDVASSPAPASEDKKKRKAGGEARPSTSTRRRRRR